MQCSGWDQRSQYHVEYRVLVYLATFIHWSYYLYSRRTLQWTEDPRVSGEIHFTVGAACVGRSRENLWVGLVLLPQWNIIFSTIFYLCNYWSTLGRLWDFYHFWYCSSCIRVSSIQLWHFNYFGNLGRSEINLLKAWHLSVMRLNQRCRLLRLLWICHKYIYVNLHSFYL